MDHCGTVKPRVLWGQILRCTGLNPNYGLRVGKASTQGDCSQMPYQTPSLGGTILALID